MGVCKICKKEFPDKWMSGGLCLRDEELYYDAVMERMEYNKHRGDEENIALAELGLNEAD